MTYRVRFTPEARDDLRRLFNFILERQLAVGGDLDLAERADDAIRQGIATLRFTPFTCRKAGASSYVRELVIPFGRTGYVALFEIEPGDIVTIAAIRHQREDDYH
ncbi:type II toxin-antitoxin system RelE/ParE family toxin [Variovorax robiniae]|uniref:Type II toxin-antitoxin system RelE/ParE family toxin n=1 Tax=Variovorax robiniae TaxID=1836199 RepID=A0ABU8X4S2_9BURK